MPLARLTDRAVVLVRGPDAHNLLHNLVTSSMDEVESAGIAYGALLSPQGKILFDFLIHRRDEGFAIDLRSEEAENFVKRMTLYRLRAKVELSRADDLAVFAAWDDGDAASEAPADPRLAALGRRFVAAPDSVSADADLAAYHAHRIACGIPEGGIDFVFGDTFPHDAAMDSLHGVSFQKGCYVGQEVVSRMQHRGTARRRIIAIEAVEDDSPLPETGAEIMAGERAIGRFGSSANGRGIGLVRLDRLAEALEQDLPVSAGRITVTAKLPEWATYSWPSTGTGTETGGTSNDG
ncbi:folate-binding protein [Afifella sp. JA880]|uniref:CAF17-like 4Fe-4S cluster assembly/insertion protein YgfZ n=1 Tax=Afifella sp. JA880 TaxID=2975280 RepID=UPI0021BA493A|nr:folate-binding protein [Afifella sp. JA880]MCT8267010.1 folate-binding protein [Afifella sp. JA880]